MVESILSPAPYHLFVEPVLGLLDQSWISSNSLGSVGLVLGLFGLLFPKFSLMTPEVHKNTLEILGFTWHFHQNYDKMWIRVSMHIICDIPKSKSWIYSSLMIASSWLPDFYIVFSRINTCINMIADVPSSFWYAKSLKYWWMIWSILGARWICVKLGVFVYYYYFVCVIFVLISKFLS